MTTLAGFERSGVVKPSVVRLDDQTLENYHMSDVDLFHDDFAGDSLSPDWVPHRAVTVKQGVLDFAPGNEGFCLTTTRRTDFNDVVMEADIRIFISAAGFVLRHQSPQEYYLVQLDSESNVCFHAMRRASDDPNDGGLKMEREIVPSAAMPALGEWCRFRVTLTGHHFRVECGAPDKALDFLAEWTDTKKHYDQGSLGFWECGGEHAQYRRLEVTRPI